MDQRPHRARNGKTDIYQEEWRGREHDHYSQSHVENEPHYFPELCADGCVGTPYARVPAQIGLGDGMGSSSEGDGIKKPIHGVRGPEPITEARGLRGIAAGA